MSQDALVEVSQPGPRLGALLIHEQAAGLPVQAEGVGRPTTSVQSGHLVRGERLVERVLSDQMTQFTDEIGVPAKLKLESDPLNDGSPAFFLQAISDSRDPVSAKARQGLATP